MTKKQITRDADQKWEEMGTKRAPQHLDCGIRKWVLKMGMH